MSDTLFEMKELQKPKVFLSSLTFNDGSVIPLAENCIVVFTGANNTGKSQILKDIEHFFDMQCNLKPIVVSNIEKEYYGSFTDEFFKSRFYPNVNGELLVYESPHYSYRMENVINSWKNKQLSGSLYKLFVKLIDTEHRLLTSKPLQRTQNPETHPIYKLHKSEQLVQILSGYFKQAFDVDLEVNRNEMIDIPLHVGNAPCKKDYTIDEQDLYYNEIAKMPRLQEQGDGMRSFASVLLDTFTSEYTITLIDEPEAFLHPPQARLLGKMLVTHNPDNAYITILFCRYRQTS